MRGGELILSCFGTFQNKAEEPVAGDLSRRSEKGLKPGAFLTKAVQLHFMGQKKEQTSTVF